MQHQHATPTNSTSDQIKISTGAGGMHDAAIIAIELACVRAHNSNSFHALPLYTQVEMITASCTPPAPVLILSWSVVVVVGAACWYCILFQLAWMLVQTFAPCTLTFAPCTCSGCHWQQFTMVCLVFLPQPLAVILHLHIWQFHLLQLEPMVFSFHPLVHILYLHSGNLHCVMVAN